MQRINQEAKPTVQFIVNAAKLAIALKVIGS